MAELNHTDVLMAEALKRSKPDPGMTNSDKYHGARTAWENCVVEIAKALGAGKRALVGGRFPQQKFIEACGVHGSLVD